MTNFLICSCDEETFDMVIGTSPVVGDHTRFVVPADIYLTEDETNDQKFAETVMSELGIELRAIV